MGRYPHTMPASIFEVDLIIDGVQARLAKKKAEMGRPVIKRRARNR